jgi:superfamily II DNA/RNA helicase
LSEYINTIREPIKHICINGKMLSDEREKAIKDFTSGNCRVMLASDIVGRGFDFTNISIVINFDMPNNIDSYIHRIGRAGRAGDQGTSLTLIDSTDDFAKIEYIVQFHGMSILSLKTISKF